MNITDILAKAQIEAARVSSEQRKDIDAISTLMSGGFLKANDELEEIKAARQELDERERAVYEKLSADWQEAHVSLAALKEGLPKPAEVKALPKKAEAA